VASSPAITRIAPLAYAMVLAPNESVAGKIVPRSSFAARAPDTICRKPREETTFREKLGRLTDCVAELTNFFLIWLGDIHYRPTASGARFPAVPNQEMFDQSVNTPMFLASELGILVKRQVSGSAHSSRRTQRGDGIPPKFIEMLAFNSYRHGAPFYNAIEVSQ